MSQVFDPQLIPSLVGTLRIALQPSKSSRKAKVSIIALTMRNEDTLKRFLAQLRGMYPRICLNPRLEE